MKYLSALCIITLVLSCSPSVAPASSGERGGRSATTATGVPANIERDILSYVNEHRRSRGLAALQMNSIAAEQAEQHSRNMATGKTPFSHNGFDQRIANIKKEMGTNFIAAVAENVAEGQESAREVVKGWLNSAGHRKNIEGNYNQTGIGVYRSRNGDLYFTQIFLRK